MHSILLSLLVILFSFTSTSTIVKVKIQLTHLSDIKNLKELGLVVDGYIIDNKYWVTDISENVIKLLEKNRYQYELMEENPNQSLAIDAPFLSGKLKTSFDDYGYQLTVSYNQSKKLSFLSIKVFDLAGKQYAKRLGYNIPPDEYDCKLNSYTWPEGIFIVQLENSKKEKTSKVIQKHYYNP